MTLIDPIADRLTHEMVRDGVQLESVPFEGVATILAVAILVEGAGDIEVVSPAG